MNLLARIRRKPDPVAELARGAAVAWVGLHDGVPHAGNESRHVDYRRVAVPRAELHSDAWCRRRYVFAAPADWNNRSRLYIAAWSEPHGGDLLTACAINSGGEARGQRHELVLINDIED